jgi:hypothetical protein
MSKVPHLLLLILILTYLKLESITDYMRNFGALHWISGGKRYFCRLNSTIPVSVVGGLISGLREHLLQVRWDSWYLGRFIPNVEKGYIRQDNQITAELLLKSWSFAFIVKPPHVCSFRLKWDDSNGWRIDHNALDKPYSLFEVHLIPNVIDNDIYWICRRFSYLCKRNWISCWVYSSWSILMILHGISTRCYFTDIPFWESTRIYGSSRSIASGRN